METKSLGIGNKFDLGKTTNTYVDVTIKVMAESAVKGKAKTSSEYLTIDRSSLFDGAVKAGLIEHVIQEVPVVARRGEAIPERKGTVSKLSVAQLQAEVITMLLNANDSEVLDQLALHCANRSKKTLENLLAVVPEESIYNRFFNVIHDALPTA